MMWPFTSGSDKDNESKRKPISWNESLNGIDWQHFREPRHWVPSAIVVGTAFAFWAFYQSYLRRFPGVNHVHPDFFRKRTLYGKVTSVGDGDNFHLFHTPGGRMAGWGLFRKVPEKRAELKAKTVCLGRVSS